MSKKVSVFFTGFFLIQALAFTDSALNYPAARRGDQIDDYRGTKVKDPYRWMEETDSPETKAWIEAENKVTSAYLSGITQRNQIKKRLTETWNYERYFTPSKHGDLYIYARNDGLQNQNVLYKARKIDGPSEVFFDPNKLAADGTVTLNDSSFSYDGKLWAYAISSAGSDRSEWKVMEVATGKLLADVLPPNRYEGLAWLKDNSGFFYVRFPEAKEGSELKQNTLFAKVYFHKLGTPGASDTVVYERPENGELVMGVEVSDDGKWLVISTTKGTERMNEVALKDLGKPDSPILPIVDNLKNSYNFIGNDGDALYFTTDNGAPKGKVVKVDIVSKAWSDVIPESKQTLTGVSFIGDELILNYLADAHTQVKVHRSNGKFVRDIHLPGIGAASGFGGKREDTETFYSYASFNAAPTIYRYEMKSGKSSIFRQAKVAVDLSKFEVKQVFYTSKDKTRVPMFLVHKKEMKLDGKNPTILYGYGGFNISMTPGFSASRAVWLEMGGVYAIANIRGGSEYGKAWWEGGSRLKKQNVFDDFIAAAEWLIKNKYTSTPKLAIQGGSNGGLLVGAVLNQRPDLFGAAVASVGVMDMLRFDKFTIGYMWKSDYGSPDEATDFKAMYAYSPYHNVKASTKYPATLITTADHDDRVFPAHSFKYTAAMQAAQAGTAPILIRIETKAGHGAGKPTTKIIDETADIYAFLVKNLGMK
jgi:prolyl oligopeptidase